MATPEDPTADYRKYPKSPNFRGIVIGASVVILLILIAAWVVLHRDAGKMLPHGANPAPNSLIKPLLPDRVSNPLALAAY